jgi:hypothetical protein
LGMPLARCGGATLALRLISVLVYLYAA